MVGARYKSIIGIVCISCISIAALIGICLLFGLFEMTTWLGCTLLTLLTVFVCALLLLTDTKGLIQANALTFMCSKLIYISGGMVILLIWLTMVGGLDLKIYPKVTVAIASLSVFINIVYYMLIKVQDKSKGLQIATYSLFALLVIYVDLLLFGLTQILEPTITFAVAAALVDIVFFVILNVISKNNERQLTVTITVEEYEALKTRIKELESRQFK